NAAKAEIERRAFREKSSGIERNASRRENAFLIPELVQILERLDSEKLRRLQRMDLHRNDSMPNAPLLRSSIHASLPQHTKQNRGNPFGIERASPATASSRVDLACLTVHRHPSCKITHEREKRGADARVRQIPDSDSPFAVAPWLRN